MPDDHTRSDQDGLSSGGEQFLLQQQRDKDRADRVKAQREGSRKERDARARGDLVRVSINAPHKADVRGNQIALTIASPTAPLEQQQGSSAPALHPFKVLDASSSGHMKAKVYADSFLFDTTDLTAPVSITGLNTNSPDLGIGNFAALKILLDSTLAVTGASIIYDTVDWDGYWEMYHIDNSDPDNPFVDEIRVLLAEIVDVIDTRAGTTITDGTNTAKIVQRWRDNILLFAYPDAAGVPVYLPIPFA